MLISSSLSWPLGPEVVEVYFIKIVILTTRLCREGALCNITLMYYIYMCLFDEFGLSNEGEMGRLNANKQQKEAKQCFWTCRLCSSQQQTPPPLVAWRRSSPTGGLANRTRFTGMRRWMQMKLELEFFHSQPISHGGAQHSPWAMRKRVSLSWYSSLCGRSRSHGCDKWTVSLSQADLSVFLIRLN